MQDKWSLHQYAPHAYTHQEPEEGLTRTYPGQFDTDYDDIPEMFDRAWLEDLLGIPDEFVGEYGVPLAVNEYGVMRWEPGAASPDLLQNAVTMTVNASREGDRLLVSVSITNDLTGHHVPTDSPLRQLILLVNATDGQG